MDDLLMRGVWRAPWLGPNGELVLLAVTRRHHLHVPPVTVPHGTNGALVSAELKAALDRDDPAPDLRIIGPRSFP